MPEQVEPASEDVLAGRYRLGELLGSGGMADVYRATDLRLGRDVAIKLFRDGVDPLLRRRLTDEANLLARLSYPGLVTVYDIGTTDASPYLVMQLVDGTTLRERVITEPYGEAAMCRLGAQLASAISYVHYQGIVHRDIKPSNVLLDRTGNPWLADFGISLLVGSTRLTATGQLIGTAGYLAPEQVLGQQVGPAADVYALGLVLLECLTGLPEYDGSDIEVAVARLHRQPRVPPGLSGPVAAALAAMTAADPAQRPDAAACAAALRAAEPSVGPGFLAAAGSEASGSAQSARTVTLGSGGWASAGAAAATDFRPAGPGLHGPTTQQLPAIHAEGSDTRQFDGPLLAPEEVPLERQFSKRTSIGAAAALLIVAAISWALLSGTGTPEPAGQVLPPAPSTTTAPPVTTPPSTPAPVQAPNQQDLTTPPTTAPAKHDKPGHNKHASQNDTQDGSQND